MSKKYLNNRKELGYLSQEIWMLEDAEVITLDNGSMEIRLIHLVVAYINSYVRKWLEKGKDIYTDVGWPRFPKWL